MRLGQHENTRDPERLKLVKGSTDDSQLAPVCDTFHDGLELIDEPDMNTKDTSDEVLHPCFKNVRFFYTNGPGPTFLWKVVFLDHRR